MIAGYEEMEHRVMLLQQNYYEVIDTLTKLTDALCAKFTNLIDEMFCEEAV